MKLTKILALVLATVLCLGVLASCGSTETNYAENNTKIKVGVSGPLTGGAAMYGIAVKNSAEMAINEINKAGGINGMIS